MILDEIHLLGADRGPILEVLQYQFLVLIVFLSTFIFVIIRLLSFV